MGLIKRYDNGDVKKYPNALQRSLLEADLLLWGTSSRNVFWMHMTAMSNNPPVFRRQFLEVAKIMDDHLAYMLAQVPLPDYEAHRPVALIRREIERKPIGRVVLVCENWGLLVNDPVRSFLLCLADEHLDKFKVLLLANSKSAGSDN